jgi:hypothetical protein
MWFFEKLKKYIFEASDDALKNAIKYVITGGSMAAVVAIVTVFGSFVPMEFQFAEARAVAAVIGFLVGISLLLLFLTRRWLFRFVSVAMICVVIFAAHYYYIHGVLHELPLAEKPLVVVVLPGEIKNLEARSEIANLQSSLPKQVTSRLFETDIRFIKTPLAGKLSLESGLRDRPLLGRFLANSVSVVGVIEVIEDGDSFVLKTFVPSVQKYFDLGLSWIEVSGGGDPVTEVTGSAGVGRSVIGVSVEIEGSVVHAGVESLNLGLSSALKEQSVSQDDLAEYRLLPIGNTISIAPRYVVTGVFFTANMAVAAYARLRGDNEALCWHAKEYIAYESDDPEFDYLQFINADGVQFCLMDESADALRRVLADSKPEELQDTANQLLRDNLSSDKYDSTLAQLDFISGDHLAITRQIRTDCNLDYDRVDIGDVDQCLFKQLSDPDSSLDEFTRIIVGEELVARLNQYLHTNNYGNRQIRKHIFQRILEVSAITETPACNADLGTLAMASLIAAAFQASSIGNSFDVFTDEFSAMFRFADCNEVEVFNINLDALMTDAGLQRNISSGLHEIFSEQNIQSKSIGELLGELLRLLKTVEGSLFTKPLAQNISFSQTYDSEIVKNYVVDVLSAWLEEIGIGSLLSSGSIFQLPFLNEPTAHDIVSELMLAIDFDKTLASASEVLDGDLSEPGVVDAGKMQKLLISIHNYLGNHFLDAYPSEITGLLVYGFEPQAFSDYVSNTDHPKNDLHKLFMYQVLRDTWSEQKTMQPILDLMAASYPEETNRPRFLHYEMLEKMNKADNNIASGLAKQVASTVDYHQSLFYQFVINFLGMPSSEPKACSDVMQMSVYPRWSDFLVENSSADLIQHLTHRDFNAVHWPENYSESEVEEDLEMQLFRFRQALQAYLGRYAYHINQEEPDELTEFDLLILDAQQSCL